MDRIDGNKTYIIAGLTIVYAIIGAIIGQLSFDQVIPLLLAGFGAFGLRSAIKKVE